MGSGKTHVAKTLGHEAARRGLDVVIFKTHKLLEKLVPDRLSARRSQLLMKHCLAAGFLILDDFAFDPYSQQETELVHALCDERPSEGSFIATSNRPPEDWFSVFPDQIVGGAIMDRLVSGGSKSYRYFRKVLLQGEWTSTGNSGAFSFTATGRPV